MASPISVSNLHDATAPAHDEPGDEIQLQDVNIRRTRSSDPTPASIDGTQPTPDHVREGTVQAKQAMDYGALWLLGAQHASSTWGDRTAEFAFYLYLIELFRDTLLPASLYGFFTTGFAIVLSSYIGSLIDRSSRPRFVQGSVLAQKISAIIAYVGFLLLFAERSLRSEAAKGVTASAKVWALFSVIVASGCMLKAFTTGISVAVERDWVICIAQGDGNKLTTLNTLLRRIDLMSKLLAPLFVSLLTTKLSYEISVAVLGCVCIASMGLELIWIRIVCDRLPILLQPRQNTDRASHQEETLRPMDEPAQRLTTSLRTFVQRQTSDWLYFSTNAVFPSSLAISLLYLTVLSFDGALISYLKIHDYQDGFIAGMRGVCVVTGLFGTVLMPLMERRLGLVRAGSWAIWGEFLSLIPVVLSFFIHAPVSGERGQLSNTLLLFGGMAISRIWLWAFDLCQLKVLQTTLNDHPRRNSLTALQIALQNIADLLKYVLTMILSRPPQFRFAALVSGVSVLAGAVSYTMYARRERGHLVHPEMLRHLLEPRKYR